MAQIARLPPHKFAATTVTLYFLMVFDVLFASPS